MGLNVPMLPYAALDTNSLMTQLGSPRIIGSYNSHNITDMPSAYSRGTYGGIGGNDDMRLRIHRSIGINNVTGLVGAAGLGFAAAKLMDQNDGTANNAANNFGLSNGQTANVYQNPNAAQPYPQGYQQPVQQGYPQQAQYSQPAQNYQTQPQYSPTPQYTQNQPVNNGVQGAYSAMGTPAAAPARGYNPVGVSSFDPNAAINLAPPPAPYANGSYNNAGYNLNPAVQNVPQGGYSPNAARSFDPNAAIGAPQAAPVQPAPPKPKIIRRRVPASGKTMVKGQKFALENPGEPPLERIKICLGWDTSDNRCELDASAFMLGSNEKVPSDDWFIFYGQPSSPEGSVTYNVFDSDPNNCDDAAIDIDLTRVDPNVQKIAVAITIYEAYQRALNFGMVPMVYARIVNCRTGAETARFELTERNSAVTALVVGELYRYKGAWKFNAVGSGVNRDLAGFCGMYGVNLE